MPMLLIGAVLLTVNCTAFAQGTTLYVAPTGNDSNPGTQAAPWRTIGKAAATLTAGQTAIVMDGTYEEGSIWFTHSGTASAPITIIAQNKWGAILSSTSGCNAAFMIGQSYITIQDLRISVSPNNVTCGIFTSSNAAVQAWSNSHASPTSPATSEAGLVIRGLYVDDHPDRRGAFKTGQDFSIIENNTVFAEIEGMNANGIIIRNNTVTTGTVSALNDSGTVILVKGGARNAQIYNNTVRMTRTWTIGAILLGGYSCLTCGWDSAAYEAFNAVAYNNVVINDSGISNLGMFVMLSCKDCTVLNNVGLGGSLSLGIGGMAALPNDNPTFKNNIFVSTGAATTGWTGAWSGTLTVDYNDFYGYSSGVPAQSHAIIGDPNFVNPSWDWHLQPGSPALGSGVEVNMTGFNGISIDVSRNKDGNIRTPPVNLGIY